MPKMRKTEIFVNDRWKSIKKFSDLKKGMIFRLFEPDNKIVSDHNGYNVFKATGDAFKNTKGIGEIEVSAYMAEI